MLNQHGGGLEENEHVLRGSLLRAKIRKHKHNPHFVDESLEGK